MGDWVLKGEWEQGVELELCGIGSSELLLLLLLLCSTMRYCFPRG